MPSSSSKLSSRARSSSVSQPSTAKTTPESKGSSTKKRPRTGHEEPTAAAGTPVSPVSKQRPPPVTDDTHVDTDDENDFYQERPEYVEHTYSYIQDQLRELVGLQLPEDKVYTAEKPGLIRKFAEDHFDFKNLFSNDDEEILARLREMSVHSALLIGCVANGGPRSVKGWLEIFTEPFERQALVSGIIGKVLEEHVFASLCFGATPKQLEELHKEIDLKHRDYPHDGFTRAQLRYERIRKIIQKATNPTTNPFGLPPDFIATSKRLAWQLFTVLEPIYALKAGYSAAPTTSPTSPTSKSRRRQPSWSELRAGSSGDAQRDLVADLYTIVVRAGILSLHMRLDPTTVYFGVCAGKDEYWDEKAMRAYNYRYMIKTNPFTNMPESDGTDETEKKRRKAQCQLALVRMALFPGWQAFKKGGWRSEDKEKGMRVCELGRQWVSLRWGRQRRWESPEQKAKRLAELQKKKKGKGKGRAKAVDTSEEDEELGWEEWLTIWGEGKPGSEAALRKIKNWFSWNVPSEEFESEEEMSVDE
ncbi:hypothetical protein BFW01_g7028 [Lasiodiplodia theobromae]|nr:hypothetical protein BFW01_g7028 [Lasiodiplodia theobromae]